MVQTGQMHACACTSPTGVPQCRPSQGGALAGWSNCRPAAQHLSAFLRHPASCNVWSFCFQRCSSAVFALNSARKHLESLLCKHACTRTRGRHVAGTVFAVFASQGGFQEELVLAPSPLGQGALGPHRPIRGFGRVSPTQEPAHQAKPRPTMARHGAAICCQCGQEDPNIRMAPPGMAPPRNARPTTVLRIGSNMQWGICELCVLMVRLQDWARDGDAEVRLSLQSVFRATLQDLDSRHSVWHWRLRRGDWECGRCHHLNVNWHRRCGLCWVEPPPTPARHSLLVPAGTLQALVLQSGHASSQSGDRPISGELSAQLGPPWEGAQFSAEGASSSGMQWRR
jgi:hypothetical protein